MLNKINLDMILCVDVCTVHLDFITHSIATYARRMQINEHSDWTTWKMHKLNGRKSAKILAFIIQEPFWGCCNSLYSLTKFHCLGISQISTHCCTVEAFVLSPFSQFEIYTHISFPLGYGNIDSMRKLKLQLDIIDWQSNGCTRLPREMSIMCKQCVCVCVWLLMWCHSIFQWTFHLSSVNCVRSSKYLKSGEYCVNTV